MVFSTSLGSDYRRSSDVRTAEGPSIWKRKVVWQSASHFLKAYVCSHRACWSSSGILPDKSYVSGTLGDNCLNVVEKDKGPLNGNQRFSCSYIRPLCCFSASLSGISRSLVGTVHQSSEDGVSNQKHKTNEFCPRFYFIAPILLCFAGYLIAMWGWWNLYWRNPCGWREFWCGFALLGGDRAEVLVQEK
jgi:hypothetical protein